jgi:cytochrome b subunit of formate dehydrogenase
VCSSCHRIHELATPAAAVAASARCRACHEAPHALHAGAAKGPQCADCHTAHAPRPLAAADSALGARCVSCHEAVHPGHPKSGERALACTTCHTLDPKQSTVPAAGLAQACTTCHRDSPAAGTHATLGVHDAARTTPQCTDCHSFGTDSVLASAGAAISARCGACHEPELAEYRAGGHAGGLEPGASRDLPTCVSCHDEHNPGETRLAATTQCVKCHSSARLARKYNLPENVGASYSDDFHGATVQMQIRNPETGDPAPVLVCADCHGAHEVGWDEATSIAGVCIGCHERGDDRLAGAWLGHARVGPGHQPLVWLVRLFYFFTIPFVLVGLALNILFHIRDQHRRGARMRDAEGLHRLRAWLSGKRHPKPATVERFNRRERLEHLGSMTTFILLVVTGLPQTRPDLAFSNFIIGLFGGIGTARVIHRALGIAFVLLLVTHATRAMVATFRTRRLPVMAPTRQDFTDTLATVRHFLQGTPKPKVGKFDFSEKFEYWGLFLGGTLMSVTGAVLLYPEAVTRVLPGELVAMFRVMHGLEATFAVLVVVLWHTYGVILKPEVFPLDTSIFTGKMTVERLKEEHELEYERLFPDGEPDEARADAAWQKEEGVA